MQVGLRCDSRGRGGLPRDKEVAEILSPRLLAVDADLPHGPNRPRHWHRSERLLKLKQGFYPRYYYQICEHGTPTQNGGAVLYRFAKANLANLNYHYRGTSPHCLNCLVAAEATGLRLQVFKVCFFVVDLGELRRR